MKTYGLSIPRDPPSIILSRFFRDTNGHWQRHFPFRIPAPPFLLTATSRCTSWLVLFSTMSSDSSNRKAETVRVSDGRKNYFSFRRNHQEKMAHEKSGTDDAIEVGATVSKIIAPVNFTELFRCVLVERLHAVWVLITVHAASPLGLK